MNSSPGRLAVVFVQASSSYGEPRNTLRLMGCTSMSVAGALTHLSQFRGRATGPLTTFGGAQGDVGAAATREADAKGVCKTRLILPDFIGGGSARVRLTPPYRTVNSGRVFPCRGRRAPGRAVRISIRYRSLVREPASLPKINRNGAAKPRRVGGKVIAGRSALPRGVPCGDGTVRCSRYFQTVGVPAGRS